MTAAGLCLVLVAAALSALWTLPTLTPDEQLAVDAVRLLVERPVVQTSVKGDGTARCERLPRRRERVVAPNGRSFLLVRHRPETIAGEPLPRALLRDAYLAGCPNLLAAGVGRRLLRKRTVYAGRTEFGGRPAHVLVATAPPTNVRLLVEAATLEPLAVRFGARSEAAYR